MENDVPSMLEFNRDAADAANTANAAYEAFLSKKAEDVADPRCVASTLGKVEINTQLPLP